MMTTIRQHLSNIFHAASVKLVPLEPVRYGVRVVRDENYWPELAGDDDESREWYAKETADLDDEATVALGVIVVRECPCCGHVDEAPHSTALWGIVIDWPASISFDKPLHFFDLALLPDTYLREVAAELIAEELAA